MASTPAGPVGSPAASDAPTGRGGPASSVQSTISWAYNSLVEAAKGAYNEAVEAAKGVQGPLHPYELCDSPLGEGGYGKVHLGRNVITGEPVAIKEIDGARTSEQAIMKEVEALRTVAASGHPNLCRFHDFREVRREGRARYYLVFEVCGDELFKSVEERGAFSEAQARPIFKAMLSGVIHMHTRGVAHRDLKLENVLLDVSSGLATPKIIDLGLAHVHPRTKEGGAWEATPLVQWCGSQSYCPPEIMSRVPYNGFVSDIWSLGVCLFAMVSGFFPVQKAAAEDWRFTNLCRAQFGMPNANGVPPDPSSTRNIFGFYQRPCPLSAELVHLLDGMLMIDPRRRLTLEQVSASAWLTAGGGAEFRQPPPPRPVACEAAAATATTMDLDAPVSADASSRPAPAPAAAPAAALGGAQASSPKVVTPADVAASEMSEMSFGDLMRFESLRAGAGADGAEGGAGVGEVRMDELDRTYRSLPAAEAPSGEAAAPPRLTRQRACSRV